jgi:TatD DNase family protein
LIDFHCHLDLFPDPEGVAAAAEAARIYVLSVTTTPKAWRKTSALGKGRPHIRTALGLHPQLAHERSQELPLFEALLDETRYVGEIGLDGSPGYGQHADIQMRVFERALSLAKERGGRIFSIHSRRAAAEVIATLRKHRCADSSILHWFSGTPRQLAEAVDLGCWFSTGPAMLRTDRGATVSREDATQPDTYRDRRAFCARARWAPQANGCADRARSTRCHLVCGPKGSSAHTAQQSKGTGRARAPSRKHERYGSLIRERTRRLSRFSTAKAPNFVYYDD